MIWHTDDRPDTNRPVLVELINPWRGLAPVMDAGSFNSRLGWWSFFTHKYTDGWKVRRWAELPQPEQAAK
jgi:hypothetical protein